jgi:hypothetical protein
MRNCGISEEARLSEEYLNNLTTNSLVGESLE